MLGEPLTLGAYYGLYRRNDSDTSSNETMTYTTKGLEIVGEDCNGKKIEIESHHDHLLLFR